MKNDLQWEFGGKSLKSEFPGQFNYAEHESSGSKTKFENFYPVIFIFKMTAYNCIWYA